MKLTFHFSFRRPGNSSALLLSAISFVAFIGLAAWFLTGRQRDTDNPELLTTTVWKGPYDLAVVARGTVQSGSNIELTCDVRSRGGSTAILDVVPEGTVVRKGDTVVELDDSLLLDEVDLQQIVVSTRQSLLAQAESNLRAAEIARSEYADGLYVTQEKQLLSDLFLAERAKADAQETLESTKVLFDKGIASSTQVEAAYSTLDDATIKFDNAQTSLQVLRNLTRQKELTLLDAAIASAQAELKSQQRNLQLEQEWLQEIKSQIAKCTIKAPADGQVVYANEPDYYRSSTYSPFVVAPGAMVRERQVIVRLPNPNDMQINISVPEAHVTQIRRGLPVSIRAEAFGDDIIEGQVSNISQFAEPSSFWNNNTNKYAATVKITNPPRELRVGMTAEARIHVEQFDDALQVPVQALVESQGHYFSLVHNGDDYETREIAIGSINDQVAAIDSGLHEGDEVVLNPRSAGPLLNLPDLQDLPPPTIVPVSAQQ